MNPLAGSLCTTAPLVQLTQFLDESDQHSISVTVFGKRKRELGLIIPGEYVATAKDGQNAKILKNELKEKRQKLKHFELEIVQCGTFPKISWVSGRSLSNHEA